MEELQVFVKRAFGEVRVLDDRETGKVLFCGKDIATALGYVKPEDAISRHCSHATKRGVGVKTGTKANGQDALQKVEMWYITEGDVYRLITHSRLPSAQKFESWVFDEVLPSIRRDGYYINRQEMKMELMEDLLSGYKELQPSKARFLHEDLIQTLKDQNKVLKGENKQLKRSLRSCEDRASDLEYQLKEVQVGLLEQAIKCEPDGGDTE